MAVGNETHVGTHSAARKKVRLPYFDNAKYLLITLVVVGHILKFGASDQFAEAKALAVWIYSFHMPAFIFLAGLFLSRERMTAKRALTHAGRYAAISVLAKLLRKAVPFIQGEAIDISFVWWGDLPWFTLALAVFYLLAWVLKKCNYVVVGVVSLAVALYAGTLSFIGEDFCLSRIIVFFPFFWLGHALTPRQVLDHFEDKRIRVACALLLTAGLAFCLWKADELFPWRDLFLGRHCYADSAIEGCTWVHRLIGYAASFAMAYGFFGVVPRGHVPFVSALGSKTLQVYLLHYEAIEVLSLRGIISAALATGSLGWLLVVAMGAVLTLLLSIPAISLPTMDELVGRSERA